MNESIISRSFSGGMTRSAFTSRVLPMFSLGLLMTSAGAYFGWNLPYPILIIAMIAELALVFTSSMWAYSEKGSLNVGIFLGFTTLSGITLVPILQWAAFKNPMLIVQALLATTVTFGALTVIGLVSKKDFSGMGQFLMMSLLGVIFASIINVFLGSSFLSLAVSAISVVIFSGFILYDMSMIRNNFSDRDYIIASLALYLNFIGLFQNILRILGIFGSSDD
jgi:FtsH-binding integral membrane protein